MWQSLFYKLSKDEERRNLITNVELLKKERNEKSKLVGELKRNKQDATEVLNSVANIGKEIASFDQKIEELEKEINWLLLTTPNILI